MTRLRWIKLWTQETINGTTRRELEPAERSLWFDLLCLAGDSPDPGTICVAPGIPYTDDQLCQLLKVPPALLERARDKMLKAGKLEKRDRCLRIAKWEHYQGDYIRVQQHRRRVSNETQTPAVTNVTPRTEQSREDGTYTEVRKEANASAKRTPARKARAEDAFHLRPEKPAKNYDQVARLHADTFGRVTTALAQVLNDMALTYPLQWIGEAYKEAASHDAKGVAYVLTILKRWREDGYKAPPPPKRGRGRPPKQRRSLPTATELQSGWGDDAQQQTR